MISAIIEIKVSDKTDEKSVELNDHS